VPSSLSHLFVPVRSLDEARRLYVDLLGWRSSSTKAATSGSAGAAASTSGADDEAAGLPVVGAVPRAFPPEPLRGARARVFREAMVRREAAEEAGESPSRAVTALSRIPRALGYHIGPE
jgi:catechol 2,3-dioxygenase-like lactoylglutathione lyase family enzyme